MYAYSKSYLKEVVETQGKLFDEVSIYSPGIDVERFIKDYMRSKTRRFIDEGKAYVCTLSANELWIYFCDKEHYTPRRGKAIEGFAADWIGQFYAYYQWYYDISSAEVVEQIPVDFIKAAYHGLHDLDLELAVRKVGKQGRDKRDYLFS